MSVREHRFATRAVPKRATRVGAVQVIAVTGGKGGVGKTTVAINLASAFAAAGRRTLLLDGDLGLANVDVLLGITPRHSLAHVISGERTLEEVILDTPSGFRIVPGASGVGRLANLSDVEILGLVQGFSALAEQLDTLIIDTPAGIAPTVLQLSQAAQHVLVVVCDEPASLTDAYGLIKVLSRNHGVTNFKVLANMVRADGAGKGLFETLKRVTSRFLNVTLDYCGEIPEDTYLKRSIREQRPVVDAFPSSRSSRALKLLGELADKWPVPAGARGNIEFFAERLVQRAPVRLEVVR